MKNERKIRRIRRKFNRKTPKKTYDGINTLGLSIEAAKNLCSGTVDANKTFKIKNKSLDFNYELLKSMVEAGKLPGDGKIV